MEGCPAYQRSFSSRQDDLRGAPYGQKPEKLCRPSRQLGNLSNTHRNDGYSTSRKRWRSAKGLPWKPASLKPIVLVPTILITIAIVIILGLLLWKTRRDGGILFAQKIDDLPAGYSFAYLYLPTIVAVMYSILWSWIDLDVKRLEPFFQLQWAVVCAGTIIVVVFWAVTPLQSGIFASSSISRSTAVPMAISRSISPVSEQADTMDGGFLNTAYGILWLGQRLPPFTTREFALAPFEARTSSVETEQNVTWSSSTVQYGTDLSCHPAVVTKDPESTFLTFDDGKGCVASQIALMEVGDGSKEFSAYYIGYANDDHVDYSLEGSGCPRNSSHDFLAIWKRMTSNFNLQNGSDFTALFCDSSYYSQEVRANVSVPDLSVLSVTPVGPKKKLSDQMVNITHFEYILGSGSRPNLDVSRILQKPRMNRRDLPDEMTLDQYGRLANLSLSWPVANMVGFAVGCSRLSPDMYFDPHNLTSAFRAAHQLLFALAIDAIMVPSNSPANVVSGRWASQMDAVILLSTFTVLVQTSLFIVIALTVYLLVIYCRRPSRLSTDPSSITAIMSLSRNPELVGLLRDLDGAGSGIFEKKLGGQRFRLQYSKKIHDQVLGLEAHPSNAFDMTQPEVSARPLTAESDPRPHPKPVRPVELSLPVGLIFMSFLTAFIVMLCVLRWKIDQHNGLPLPSNNPVVQQLILNYLPTSVSTLIEPFWVVLNRLLCILQPFDELRRGNAAAAISLNVNYTSLPPQLVLWRALRAKHFLLTAVCSTALLANVLTIALSGLFNQSFVYLSDDILVSQLHLASTKENYTYLNSATVMDQFYVANSNITASTTLPAWVTPEYFLLPFELPQSADRAARYKAVTTGIGAELECKEMNTTSSRSIYEFTLNNDATKASLSTSHYQPDGSILRCYSGFGDSNSWLEDNRDHLTLWGSPKGTNALEFLTTMVANNFTGTSIERGFCQTLLVGGWIRSNITLAPLSNATSQGSTLNTTSVSMNQMFMVCQPKLRTAPFEITVDNLGTIFDTKPTALNSTTANITDLFSLSKTLIRAVAYSSGPIWHNDSFASDWANYLIKKRTNSSAITDPYAPVPLFAPTAALVSEIYTRTFAILLSINTAWSPSLSSSSNPTTISAKVITGHWRVFMNPTMFNLALTILSLDLTVAAWLYAARPKAFLPRMPTTLASVIAFFAAGNLLEDLKREGEHGSKADSVEEQMKHLDRKGWKFGFGKLFPGTDGRSHVGIERVPFFTSLEHEGEQWARSEIVWRRVKRLGTFKSSKAERASEELK
ncbi:MAG: hypothetical protein M1830_009346 [Pleopsidium flavum]|nr:MAG: hypothetical protein M1830_009346 [Pleopsidium flavum]